MKIIEIKRDAIDAFRDHCATMGKWPAHGINDSVDSIVVALDDSGNVLDFQCEDADWNEIEPGPDSGAALAALFDVARDGGAA